MVFTDGLVEGFRSLDSCCCFEMELSPRTLKVAKRKAMTTSKGKLMTITKTKVTK